MPNLIGHTDSIRNSQFKAAWQSGPTRTIRVPIALAEITLKYARQLDQGIEPRDTVLISDTEVGTAISEPRDTDVDANSQSSNLDESVATEPHDTSKLSAELEDTRADYAKLLESSTRVTNKLKEELQKVRSRLETERADREEVEAELSDLRQKSVTASREFPEPADLLNQLKGLRKKSRADLADMEAVLEILSYSEE